MAIDSQSGRAVAIARRVALSAGKAALPPPAERVRDGLRSASTPQTDAVRAAPPVQSYQPAPAPIQQSRLAASGLSGRAASVERRVMLSAGKTALGLAAPPPSADPAPGTPGRDISRARRVALSQTTSLVADPASQAPRVVAPLALAGAADGALRVTGSRIGRGTQVTGDERATVQQVSGTQHVEMGSTGSWRSGGPKVGFAKTSAGLTVSGSMVRSAVSVTGDEAGNAAVTGRVDQAPRDDLTTRNSRGGVPSSQFQRLGPQGAAFGGQPGSRERVRERAAEATESGFAITGSALGGGGRVTGDQGGASRRVTGTNYLAPARLAADRRTPNTTAPVLDQAEPLRAIKGGMAESWGGQSITGLDVEHNKRVTGDAPGNCSALTGSQYQGPTTIGAACETGKAETATQRRMRAKANRAITGNAGQQSESVTGIARGAGRDITGTPMSGSGTPPAPANDPIAAQDAGFSIRSPQRTAHLAPARASANEERITGSFAGGTGKLTGNLEFQARSRASEAGRQAASAKVSGEGSTKGTAITGNGYGSQTNVTGVGSAFVADRNPTQRGPKAKVAVNVANPRAEAAGEPKQLVTGLFGSFSKAGARVTLSGGAQT